MRPRERISAAVGVAAIFIAVLFVGSAFRWVEASVAIAVALAIVPLVLSRRAFSQVPPLIATLAAAVALCAAQLVPLPAMLVSALQPVGASLREEGAALAGTSPWQAITLDAPGTLRAMCFFIVLIGVAWIALRNSVTSSGRYRVLATLAGVCGVTAVVTGIHTLLGATTYFGIYDPRLDNPTVLGPLINTNHLGCLMALGAVVAGGLMMYSRQRSWLRALWLGVAVACATVAVATQSRGAVLALAVGSAIAAGVMVAQRFLGGERKSRASFLTTSLPVAVVAVSAIVVIIYSSAGGVSHDIAKTSLDEVQNPKSKFAIWRAATELVHETPFVGVGRGAFEPAVTHTHPAAAFHSFSHVENEYIQAIVDWGIPGACLLGIGLLWIVVTGARRWKDGPLTAGAIGAIAVVALQSTVDFGIELLGLAIPLTVLVATVTYVPLQETTSRQKVTATTLRIAQLVGLAVAAILLFTDVTKSIAEDHDVLRSRDKLSMADVRASIERHPLDYYGFAVAAQLMYRDQDPRAVTVLNHALRLHPSHPGLHHIAARALVQTKRFEQAAIEYGHALHGTTRVQPMLAEVIKQLPAKDAAAAIPVDMPEFDLVVNTITERGDSTELVTLWLARVLAARPGHPRACDWLYGFAINARDVRAAEEASRQCVEHALDHPARIALAGILLEKERYAEATRMLHDVETWQGRIDLRMQAWLLRCDIDIARHNWDEAKRCVRRLDVSGMVVLEKRGEVESRLEKIEEQRRATTPN